MARPKGLAPPSSGTLRTIGSPDAILILSSSLARTFHLVLSDGFGSRIKSGTPNWLGSPSLYGAHKEVWLARAPMVLTPNMACMWLALPTLVLPENLARSTTLVLYAQMARVLIVILSLTMARTVIMVPSPLLACSSRLALSVLSARSFDMMLSCGLACSQRLVLSLFLASHLKLDAFIGNGSPLDFGTPFANG